MQRKAFFGLFFATAALILTACGGSSKPSTTINVTLTDFAFVPNSFAVPAGQEISLTATNDGAVMHSFLIMKLGKDVNGHFTPDDQANVLWQMEQIPSGETIKATFVAPSEPGSYQIVCGVGGHLEAGMVAKLVVVATP